MKRFLLIILFTFALLNPQLTFARGRNFRTGNSSLNSIRQNTLNTNNTNKNATSSISNIIAQNNTTTDTNNNEDMKYINEQLIYLKSSISNVKSKCLGIKKDLDLIFGLTTATTIVSGVGTLVAGGALATGLSKEKIDKELENLQNYTSVELFNFIDTYQNQRKEELEKKSKTLGNIRTGLLAGATATSIASTGTSIGATINAKKLAKKMEECNNSIEQLKIAQKSMEEIKDKNNDLTNHFTKAGKILTFCTGYNKKNINTLKTKMTASSIISGIGSATSITGTITSAFANSEKIRNGSGEKEKKKENNLNLVSNIMAGITTGTSLSTTAISATAITDAKKDSDMAEKCEKVLYE